MELLLKRIEEQKKVYFNLGLINKLLDLREVEKLLYKRIAEKK